MSVLCCNRYSLIWRRLRSGGWLLFAIYRRPNTFSWLRADHKSKYIWQRSSSQQLTHSQTCKKVDGPFRELLGDVSDQLLCAKFAWRTKRFGTSQTHFFFLLCVWAMVMSSVCLCVWQRSELVVLGGVLIDCIVYCLRMVILFQFQLAAVRKRRTTLSKNKSACGIALRYPQHHKPQHLKKQRIASQRIS